MNNMQRARRGTIAGIGTFLAALLLCIQPGLLPAQMRGLSIDGTAAEQLLKPEQQSLLNSLQQRNQSQMMPTDNVVDADTYYVGPGDVLLLQIVGASPIEYPTIVSPECTVLIPRIGEISVKNLTLRAAKDSVLKVIHQRNPNWTAYVTLVQARMVFVRISGNVAFPRMYALPASMKVSTAVKLANELISVENTDQLKIQKMMRSADDKALKGIGADIEGQYVAEYPERNTMVFRNGATLIADAAKAALLNRPAADPTLREGDEIFVPFDNQSTPYISIAGAVRRPAVLAYREGDSLSLLLKSCYGLGPNADRNNIYLVSPGGKRRGVDYDAVMAGSDDVALEPGASVIVGQKQRANDLTSTVAVTGAVKVPGTYVIEHNRTRLKDVIDRAGGFTEEAYLPLSYIRRRDLLAQQGSEDRFDQVYRNYQYSNLELGDTARFILHMNLRKPRVSCDFVAAFKESSTEDNVPLQDGDVIVVPGDPKNVYVFGQVQKPGYVEYVPGRTLAWYIERTGGVAEGGEAGRAAVIKGRTQVWIEDDEAIVESGDQIYVPAAPQYPPGIEEQKYSLIVSIASSAVFLLATVLNFFK